MREQIGARAADEHRVACRTPNDRALPQVPGVRVVDAVRRRAWLESG